MIKEIGQGGQSIAYLVRDTDQLNLPELLNQLRRGITSLVGSNYPEEYERIAVEPLEAMEKFIQRESDDFCAVLKLLHESAREDAKALERLRREVDILGQLDHPSLIKIIDSSVNEGWYVMPYYQEGTLAQQLHRFRGHPQKALEAFQSLLEGVASLHGMSVVHRDIKPENILYPVRG